MTARVRLNVDDGGLVAWGRPGTSAGRRIYAAGALLDALDLLVRGDTDGALQLAGDAVVGIESFQDQQGRAEVTPAEQAVFLAELATMPRMAGPHSGPGVVAWLVKHGHIGGPDVTCDETEERCEGGAAGEPLSHRPWISSFCRSTALPSLALLMGAR